MIDGRYTGRAPASGMLSGMPYMFARLPDGRHVERDAVCECGRAFRQSRISEEYRAWAEERGAGEAMAAVPWSPTKCNPCERRDLSGGDRPAVLPLSHSHRVVLLEQAQHGQHTPIHDFKAAQSGDAEDSE